MRDEQKRGGKGRREEEREGMREEGGGTGHKIENDVLIV